MMQASVYGARIDQMRECHLVDTPQALVVRMGNNGQQKRMIHRDETMHRVIDDLSEREGHSCIDFVKTLAKSLQIYKQRRTL
jgi:hypothetical protein